MKKIKSSFHTNLWRLRVEEMVKKGLIKRPEPPKPEPSPEEKAGAETEVAYQARLGWS